MLEGRIATQLLPRDLLLIAPRNPKTLTAQVVDLGFNFFFFF